MNFRRGSLLVLSLVLVANAQGRYPIEQRTDSQVRFDVVAVRKQTPAFAGESSTRVFLRIVNHNRGQIYVQAFDLSGRRDDGALLHEVFEETACPKDLSGDAGAELPIGYSRLHTFSIVEIPPAGSRAFSVPVDHLQRSRCVRVRYWFGQGVLPNEAKAFRYVSLRAKGGWADRMTRDQKAVQPAIHKAGHAIKREPTKPN
jgi:hypothetical protein